MIRIPPPRWTDLTASKGLLLFAQRVDELLFDYTLDSYRAPALNTHSRCAELIEGIAAVRVQQLKPAALDSIIEELARSIADDEVAKLLIGPASSQLADKNFWPKSDLNELRVRAAWLRRLLGTGRYRKTLIATLESLLPIGHEKERILGLTRDLVVEWINSGHPKTAIFYHCRQFFFEDKGRSIFDSSPFRDFVELFEGPVRPLVVLLGVNSSFSKLKGVALPTGMEILTTRPPAQRSYSRESEILAASTVFVRQEVSARDAVSARNMTEESLSQVSYVARLHLHRTQLDWEDTALVYDDKYVHVIERPAAAVAKLGESDDEELPTRFERTLGTLSTDHTDVESRDRFWRVLSLHSAAVVAPAVENQLMNLWAAIETMLPLTAEDTRIVRTTDLVVPILSRHYMRKKLLYLHRSLLRSAPSEYEDAIRKVQGPGNRLHGAVMLLAVKANWALWDPVYAMLDNNPLLVNRISEIANVVSSPKAMKVAIEEHANRVRWQLHRIYRVRNLIAHSGRRMRYTAALVENLHSYLHELIADIERALASEPSPFTIDAALLQLRLEHETHLEALRQSHSDECTEGTCVPLVLGPDT